MPEPNLEQNQEPLKVDPSKVPGHWLDDKVFSSMSDELKAPLRKYTNPVDAFKGASEAQKKMGTMISPLKENATPEERAEYKKTSLKTLGVPDTSAEYTIEYPNEFPDDKKMSDRAKAEFLEFAHQQGLLPEQVQAYVEFASNNMLSSERMAKQDAITQASQMVRETFPDNPVEMLKYARTLAEEYGGEDAVNMIFELDGKPKNGALAVLFAKIGEHAYGETSFVPGQGTRGEQREKQLEMQARFPNTPKDLL